MRYYRRRYYRPCRTEAEERFVLYLMVFGAAPVTCGFSLAGLPMLLWVELVALADRRAAAKARANAPTLEERMLEARRQAQRERVQRGIANRSQWAIEQAARNRATYLASQNRG
jgi:hypothetical protein